MVKEPGRQWTRRRLGKRWGWRGRWRRRHGRRGHGWGWGWGWRLLLLPPLLLLSFSSSSGDAARGAARAGDECEEADFGLQASYVTTCVKPPHFFITASTYDILTSFMIFGIRLFFIEFKNNSTASSWSCFMNKMFEIDGVFLDRASHYTK